MGADYRMFLPTAESPKLAVPIPVCYLALTEIATRHYRYSYKASPSSYIGKGKIASLNLALWESLLKLPF